MTAVPSAGSFDFSRNLLRAGDLAGGLEMTIGIAWVFVVLLSGLLLLARFLVAGIGRSDVRPECLSLSFVKCVMGLSFLFGDRS